MKVSFFAQPDLKDFLPEAAQPFFRGEMVAGGFNVEVVYEPAPINTNVWHDGTTFFQTPGKPRLRPISLRPCHSNSGQIDVNFGHVVLNELLSAYVGPCANEIMHLD